MDRKRNAGLVAHGVDHLLDHLALLIQQAGVSALISYPVLVVVGEKKQILFAGLQVEAVFAMFAEDSDLARLFAFYFLVDMHHIVGAIQGVSGLRHLARRHHGADHNHLGFLHLLGDGHGVRASRERSCGEKNAS